MNAARRLTLTFLASLCALGMLFFFGSSAYAGVVHEYLTSIAKEVPAVGPHSETVPHPGPLQEAQGMTFDSGNLYIADRGGGSQTGRLDVFDASSGTFVQQFPELQLPLYDFSQSLAAGHATGETEVYDIGDEAPELGAVAVTDAAGKLQGVWKGADTPSKAFGCFQCRGHNGGVAVDNSAGPDAGDVYVVDEEHKVVDVFKPLKGGGEEYVTQLTGPEQEINPEIHFTEVHGVAVSAFNGDVLVTDGREVDVFEPTLLGMYSLVTRLTRTPGGLFGRTVGHVTVDSGDGDIYVTVGEGGDSAEFLIDQFDAEGKYLGQITELPAGDLVGTGATAVDPGTHDLYVVASNEGAALVAVFGPNIIVPDVSAEAASNVAPTSATLNGKVNPANGGEATCRFVWGTSPGFGKSAPCEPEGVAEGGSPVPVHASLSGLQPDTTYYYRLQATNRADGSVNPGEPLEDQQFTTPGPGIRDESASDVASTSATLDASINPHNLPTTYYFQYGTSVSYGTEVPGAPGAPLGAGEGELEVARHVQGLTAGTVYHFRVVAVSEPKPGAFEVFDGPDETLATQPAGSGLVLPDGRHWEMVSPPEKRGAALVARGMFAASVNGNAVTFITTAATEANPAGFALKAEALARRGPDGWIAREIGTPHLEKTGVAIGLGLEYRLFSEDLSHGVVQPFTEGGVFNSLLSPEASENTPYLRTNYLNGNVGEPCEQATMPCYRPLVTGKAGYANVPPGTVFDQKSSLGAFLSPQFEGATSDLSHILVFSKVPLTNETSVGENLFEWAGGKLTAVGNIDSEHVEFGRHAISDDGSRVVLSGESEGKSGLLLRDTVTGETLKLDAPQGKVGAEPLGTFAVASSDDSRVFFTDGNLGPGKVRGEELYECAIVVTAGKLACDLTDLTPPTPEGGAGVENVVGASEDGSYVYFVATGALAEGAVPGAYNLYLRHNGVTTSVAALSSEDRNDWDPTKLTSRVSPNGQWLAFMAQEGLTGNVTRDARSGRPDELVYLYHAAGAGSLVCASCNPTGARPVGDDGEIELANPSFEWSERSLAATIPGRQILSNGFYQSRVLSDSGRLFFNSSDALVPQDVNGTWDVYEYEPPAVGGCTISSLTYSARSSGCVDLISSGTSAEESAFLDASASGGDVFFLTAAKLAREDFDPALDLYDAHECTASVPCYPTLAAPPPPCDTGDACKASPTPQPAIFGSPSSSTFSGAGNITPSSGSTGASAPGKPAGKAGAKALAKALRSCRKQRGKRPRATCERKARARYAKGSRKANTTGKGRG
jgi:hypothetical protein